MLHFAKPIMLSLALGLILGLASFSLAEEKMIDYSQKYKTFTDPGTDMFITSQMSNLRILHEGTVFVLKRYATMEALITAVDRGKPENEAFLIGGSSVIPGVGQIINEDYLQGGLLLFASSISWGTIRHLEFTRKKEPGTEHLLPLYYSSLALRNGIMTYAMLHASNSSYRADRDRTRAMWIGSASLVPGVGQAINGDWWEAGALLVGWSMAAVLTSHFEKQIYISGEEGYLVEDRKTPDWAIAWLPGGAMLSVTAGW